MRAWAALALASAASAGDDADPSMEDVVMLNRSVAITMLASILVILMFFYLVRVQLTKIKAWVLLQQVSTIFLAVAWFDCFKTIVDELRTGTDVKSPIAAAHATFWLVMLYVVSWVLRHKEIGHPIGHVLAHVMGFAAVYVFTDLQERYCATPLESFGAWALTLVCCCVIFVINSFVRKYLVKRAKDHHEAEHFVHTMLHHENDAVSFILSSVWTKAVLHAFCAQYPAPHAPLPEVPAMKWGFLGYCVGFLIVGMVGSNLVFGISWIKTWSRTTSSGHRTRLIVDTMMAMIVAWGFWYWGEWEFYNNDRHNFLRMVYLATGFSFVVGFLLVVLSWWDEDDEYSFDEVILQAGGVLVGFSWEHTFHGAVNMLVVGMPNAVEMKVAFLFGMVALIFPAVVLVIHPVNEAYSKHAQQLSKAQISQLAKRMPSDTGLTEEHLMVLSEPAAIGVGMISLKSRKAEWRRVRVTLHTKNVLMQHHITRTGNRATAFMAGMKKLSSSPTLSPAQSEPPSPPPQAPPELPGAVQEDSAPSPAGLTSSRKSVQFDEDPPEASTGG